MAGVATMKVGDTGRQLSSVLRYGDGTPIDLTGCDVRLRLRRKGGGYAVLDGPCTVVGAATAGTVTYDDWEATGAEVVEEPGTYVAEYVVEDAGG